MTDVPKYITNSKEFTGIWGKLSQTEKKAYRLISSTFSVKEHREVMDYFTFAEEWNKLFPKKGKKDVFQNKAIGRIVRIAGISKHTLHDILHVTEFFGVKRYTEMYKESQRNEVTLYWSILRTLCWRFNSNPKGLDAAIADVVSHQYTVEDLKRKLGVISLKEKKERAKYVWQKVAKLYIAFNGVHEYIDRIYEEYKQVKTSKSKAKMKDLIAQIDNVVIFFNDIKEGMETDIPKLNEVKAALEKHV